MHNYVLACRASLRRSEAGLCWTLVEVEPPAGVLFALPSGRRGRHVAQNVRALPHVAIFTLGALAIRQSDHQDLLRLVFARLVYSLWTLSDRLRLPLPAPAEQTQAAEAGGEEG